MSFKSCLACVLAIVVVLAASAIAVTVVMSGEDFNDKCSAPSVPHGQVDARGWSDKKNGEALVTASINCDTGYHRSRSIALFRCKCESDGDACAALEHACEKDACTVPDVENGTFDTWDWEDVANGTALNVSRVICDAGFGRTADTSFRCICSEDNAPCETLDGACRAGPATPGNDPSDLDQLRGRDSGGESSSASMPDWLLACIVIGDVLACVLLGLGVWLCYDNHTKKQGEKYWARLQEYRAKQNPGGQDDVPVATQVRAQEIALAKFAPSGGSGSAVGMGIPEATPMAAAAGVGGATSFSATTSFAARGNQAASRAIALDNCGKYEDAIRCYESAVSNLSSAIEGAGTSDETYSIAVKVGNFKDRIDELKKLI